MAAQTEIAFRCSASTSGTPPPAPARARATLRRFAELRSHPCRSLPDAEFPEHHVQHVVGGDDPDELLEGRLRRPQMCARAAPPESPPPAHRETAATSAPGRPEPRVCCRRVSTGASPLGRASPEYTRAGRRLRSSVQPRASSAPRPAPWRSRTRQRRPPSTTASTRSAFVRTSTTGHPLGLRGHERPAPASEGSAPRLHAQEHHVGPRQM